MKLLIHDLPPEAAGTLFADQTNQREWQVVADDGTIHPCIGCFGCWIKTPGACVIRDRYGDMGRLLAQSEELVLVTRCCYGGPSPFVKNVLDRSISYILPDFVIKNGEMHHRQRYPKTLNLRVVFYGEAITEADRRTAEKWVNAAAVNLYCEVKQIQFCRKAEAVL